MKIPERFVNVLLLVLPLILPGKVVGGTDGGTATQKTPYFEIGKYWIYHTFPLTSDKIHKLEKWVVVEELEYEGMQAVRLRCSPQSEDGSFEESPSSFDVYRAEKDNVIYQYAVESDSEWSEPQWVPIIDFNLKPGEMYGSHTKVKEVEEIEFMQYPRTLITLDYGGYYPLEDYLMTGVGSLGCNYISPVRPWYGIISSRTAIWECGTEEGVIYTNAAFWTFLGYAQVGSIEAQTDSESEYFTIDGLRVAAPRSGQLLIRRQGANVGKVLIP